MESTYNAIGKILIAVIAYLISSLLVKKRKISLLVQRRLWNVLLLAFFLVSCLLGILLAVLIDYGISVSWYMEILKLHVDAGIYMTVIAIFHTFWHLNYYRSIIRRRNTGLVDEKS